MPRKLIFLGLHFMISKCQSILSLSTSSNPIIQYTLIHSSPRQPFPPLNRQFPQTNCVPSLNSRKTLQVKSQASSDKREAGLPIRLTNYSRRRFSTVSRTPMVSLTNIPTILSDTGWKRHKPSQHNWGKLCPQKLSGDFLSSNIIYQLQISVQKTIHQEVDGQTLDGLPLEDECESSTQKNPSNECSSVTKAIKIIQQRGLETPW